MNSPANITKSIDELEEQAGKALEHLSERIRLLKGGSPETDRLIDVVGEIVDRYIFIAAYTAANRGTFDWHQLVEELLADEGDLLLLQPDPGVREAYELSYELEKLYRADREARRRSKGEIVL
ncbi:MAG: hypothetical protein QXI12_10665 [Candidatus Methanomethyliaceae archaeon]